MADDAKDRLIVPPQRELLPAVGNVTSRAEEFPVSAHGKLLGNGNSFRITFELEMVGMRFFVALGAYIRVDLIPCGLGHKGLATGTGSCNLLIFWMYIGFHESNLRQSKLNEIDKLTEIGLLLQ